jgi:hypothetical protein
MTPQMHAQLASLHRLFFSGEISDEEWALLQIHLAYCDDCCRTFLESQQISTSVVPTPPVSSIKDPARSLVRLKIQSLL